MLTFYFISGAGIFVSGVGTILNNSAIEANSNGQIPQLLCLSGSNMSVAGAWISPGGMNLVAIQNDPFDIVVGDSNNPGLLLIETPDTNPPFTVTHEGVYTCRIPNENGQNEFVHLGIYFSTSKLSGKYQRYFFHFFII